MHDILAQRVSLVALHAGGLEMRPSLPPDEVRRTAGVIRTSARQALEELRDVIGLPAPHAPATVSRRGGPGKGLQVDVRNPLPRAAATALPGAGSGLVGLAERVTLAGAPCPTARALKGSSWWPRGCGGRGERCGPRAARGRRRARPFRLADDPVLGE